MSGLSALFALEKAGRYREALERLDQHRRGAPGFSPISPFNLDLLEKRLRARLSEFSERGALSAMAWAEHRPGSCDVPRVSIIVPVYRVEKYLETCLESLVAQTLSEIEILLIDDGSPDRSGSIAETWRQRDGRIRVIHQENRGSGAARNAGLDIATGEYIGFVDADDWVSEDYFERLYETAQQQQADVAASSGALVCNEAEDSLRKKDTGFSGEVSITRIEARARLFLATGITWNKIYRRAFLETHRIRFSEIDCTGQDNIVCLLALALANVIATTEQGRYFYRLSAESSTQSPRTRKHLQIVDIYHELHEKLLSSNLETDYADVLRERMRDDFVRQARGMEEALRAEFLARIHERFGDTALTQAVDASGRELLVSLTSYPPRIGKAHQAIESLLKQTMKADRVILWLAESEFPQREEDLPAELLALRPKGLSIEWCENLRSYKKIIPALRKYPQALICVADDDTLYPGDWLQKLYDSYRENPEVISGLRMRRIELAGDGWPRPYRRWPLSADTRPSFLNILTGMGGVLYPPGVFHEDVARSEVFMKLAPRGDDLWLWAMAVLQRRKIRAADTQEFAGVPIDGSQDCALWNSNGLEDENDLQVANILTHYPELTSLLREAQAEEALAPQNTRHEGKTSSLLGNESLLSALAENLRLCALVDAQKRIRHLEAQNALNARLGNLLLTSVTSGAVVSLPFRLGKFFRESCRKTPPKSLGKHFEKLIAAFEQGGFAAVEARLLAVSISPAMQASAYTALARCLLERDRAGATEAARRAYEIDPKPYRLKWLIFRLHETGDVIEAEALLDILPLETPFSPSETRQARQLRKEARITRQREARRKNGNTYRVWANSSACAGPMA